MTKRTRKIAVEELDGGFGKDPKSMLRIKGKWLTLPTDLKCSRKQKQGREPDPQPKKDNGKMKLQTVLSNQAIRDFFRSYASNRCASYVADALTAGEPHTRGAKEHLCRNGGHPSERAHKLLAWAHEVGSLGLEVRALLATEDATDENSHNTDWPEWEEVSALQLCNPREYALWVEQAAKAGDEWWQREGKYEAMAEDQGTYKDYLYACSRADQFGEEHPHISEFVQ